MTHDELKALAGTYAVGALDGDELTEFSEHLLGCWGCRRAVMEFDEVYADGARGLTPVQPSAGAKAALLSRASGTGKALPPRETPTPEAVRDRTSAALKLAAAAGVLLAVLGWQTAARRDRVIEAQRARLDAETELLVFLGAPDTHTRPLVGQEPAPSAAGAVWWREGRVGLVASGLPPVSGEAVYQLWALVGERKQSLGLFPVDAQGAVRALRTLGAPLAADVQGFALTAEPAGGVPQPTGAVHLLSP